MGFYINGYKLQNVNGKILECSIAINTWWLIPRLVSEVEPQLFLWDKQSESSSNWGELTHILSGMSRQVDTIDGFALPSGKHTKSYGSHGPLKQMVYLLKMVIFHSYVKLPEGNEGKMGGYEIHENIF